MNIKQLFIPRPLRLAQKRSRRAGVRLRAFVLSRRLAMGFPRWVAEYLKARVLGGKVVLAKQNVLAVATPSRYLRFTTNRKAAERLAAEFASWQGLRTAGFGDILPEAMELEAVPGGTVLATELLAPVARERRGEAILHIARRLVAAAVPMAHSEPPASIEQGLAFAARFSGGRLPPAFASETRVREAFAAPLLTGYSHRDIHWMNVLLRNGRPVLIDLKKCSPGRVLALDLLNAACKSLAARDGANVLTQALNAQREGWAEPEVRDILDLVDLPRDLWGPAYALHVIGLYAAKRGGDARRGPAVLFRRLLSLDWHLDWHPDWHPDWQGAEPPDGDPALHSGAASRREWA